MIPEIRLRSRIAGSGRSTKTGMGQCGWAPASGRVIPRICHEAPPAGHFESDRIRPEPQHDVGPHRARQCDKTTIARELLAEDSFNYFDLEDPVSLARPEEPMTALPFPIGKTPASKTRAGPDKPRRVRRIQIEPPLQPVVRAGIDRDGRRHGLARNGIEGRRVQDTSNQEGSAGDAARSDD